MGEHPEKGKYPPEPTKEEVAKLVKFREIDPNTILGKADQFVTGGLAGLERFEDPETALPDFHTREGRDLRITHIEQRLQSLTEMQKRRSPGSEARNDLTIQKDNLKQELTVLRDLNTLEGSTTLSDQQKTEQDRNYKWLDDRYGAI